jgi:AI-2E family transporter
MLQLVGSTIRNVARGVVGIALLQAMLAGIGFVVAGIPAAGLFTFLALLLGIVQIGPSILIIPIIIWSWTKMDPTSALIFTAYMIPVSLADNVLRPAIMARGLSTPMPVILVGVIGWYDSVWHKRPVRRAYRSGRALGFDPGLGGGQKLDSVSHIAQLSHHRRVRNGLLHPRTPAARAGASASKDAFRSSL